MIPRMGAFFASIMACMSALHVLRVMLRALATVTPRGSQHRGAVHRARAERAATRALVGASFCPLRSSRQP